MQNNRYCLSFIVSLVKHIFFFFKKALEVIKLLQSSGTLKIGRAEMKIRIQIPVKEAKKLKEKVLKVLKTKYSEEFDTEYLEIVIL